jgi:hypothetical protein
MEKISGLTKKSFKHQNLNRAANAALICHVSKRCMGEIFKKGFLKEVEIISFREGTLFISTPNPTYSQEIKMKEKDILDKINLDLKSNLVDKIKFKISKEREY